MKLKTKRAAMPAALFSTTALMAAALPAMPVAAKEAYKAPTKERPAGFIDAAKEGIDLRTVRDPSKQLGFLCASASRELRVSCPRGVNGAVFPDPIDSYSAKLPHLKVVVVVDEVSVSAQSDYDLEVLNWKFDSPDVSVSYPASDGGAVYWDSTDPDAPFVAYEAIVENGCVGSGTTVDISLDSQIIGAAPGEAWWTVLGSVSLQDDIDGWGDYVWEAETVGVDYNDLPITAISGGYVDAFCTNQTSLDAAGSGFSPAEASGLVQSLVSPDFRTMAGVTISVGWGDDGTQDQVDVGCAGDDNFCATNFVAWCDLQEGGMSTNPDGTVTCSFDDEDYAGAVEPVGAQNFVTVPDRGETAQTTFGTAGGRDDADLEFDCSPAGSAYCGFLVKACDNVDGVLESIPPDGIRCTVDWPQATMPD